MQNSTALFIGLISIISLTLSGCGADQYPAVSGTITAAGKPVPNIRVTFAPQAVGNNITPGPFSTGVTDETGVFKLTTRYQEPGAVAGPHQISFEWANMDFDAMSSLRQELREAKGDETKTAKLEAEIAALKQKRKSLPKVNIHKVDSYTVPADGTDGANFDIGKNSEAAVK